MKKYAVIFELLLFCIIVAFAIPAIGADHTPTVLLDGAKGDFIFTNVDNPTQPNLFSDMQGIMPGDIISERIRVGVTNFNQLGSSIVSIGLSADDKNEDYRTLMASSDLRVLIDGTEIAEGTLDDGVLLKTFDRDGTVNVDVVLSIDKEAGNEVANLAAGFNWNFYVLLGPQLNREDHFAYVFGYPDGTVGPERNITRAEVAAIFYRLLTEDFQDGFSDKKSFSDVDQSSWYGTSVATLSAEGIISGYPDGTFQPNNAITRSEMAAIASRFHEITESSASPKAFSDVTNHWAKESISLAAERGWINGYPDGTFRPNKNITRAEAMTLINNMLGRSVDEIGLSAQRTNEKFHEWPDNSKSAWYYYAVMEATHGHDYERSDRQKNDLFSENWITIR